MNYRLFELINDLTGRFAGVDDVMEFVASWLIYPVIASAAGVVAMALRRRRFGAVARFAATVSLAFVGAAVLASMSHELRPYQSHSVHRFAAHDPGPAMPALFATTAFALALAVYAFVDQRWGRGLAVAAVAIGAAQVWAGLHYPGDILAAFIVAGLAVVEVVVLERWRRTLAEATARIS